MPQNITLKNEFAEVTVSPDAGASLRSIKILKDGNSYELLSGGEKELDPTDLPHGDGSFIMAPWVNRIRDGRLVTPDGVHELPMNDPPHAIHGLLREREWTVKEVTGSSVELEITLEEPWPYAGHIEYSIGLEDKSLVHTMRLISSENETRAFPGSVGWHPWFNTSLGSDPVTANADVSGQWELVDPATATGNLSVTDATTRLQNGTQFKTGEVDGCFLRNPNGTAVLSWPELTLTISGSEAITHFMFYSPEHALCVEPQTCTVDAAQLADRGIADTGHVLVDRENPLIATTVWSWE
jgi:aldose 1-epimerase